MLLLKKLKITTLSSTGEGIGSENGYKIFVDGALPGELVEIEILEEKKKFAIAKLLRVLEPSPLRIKPICPIFGKCGGCQIMHLQYEEQLQVKRQRVIDALQRIGHINSEVKPCIASPKSFHYRNKIQLPCRSGDIGLYKKNSHEIIPIETCYIQCEEGEEILKLIRPHLLDPSIRHICIKNGNKQALVIIVTDGKCHDLKERAKKIMHLSPQIKGVLENINTRDDNVILSEDFKLHCGTPYIFETLLGKTFRISASSFFQVNPLQAENLIKEVIDIEKTDKVLDAFCGVGTFSLFAAEKGAFITGIEIVPHAIDDAKENAKLNNISNVSFHVGKTEKMVHSLGDFDVVLLNPPRKGCDQSLIDTLIKKKIKKITYISCDPATLARDLSFFVQANYKIISIQPFDMFPQTMHVETVVKITL